MNSFNSYGQTSKSFGGNTPVWLGTVKPIPKGAVLSRPNGKWTFPLYIPAGTPVQYNPNDGRPLFYIWEAGGTDGAPNGYLYNDIYVESDPGEENFATGAIVMHHAEGLLIERTGYGEYMEELQAAIPGVLLVAEYVEGKVGPA